MKTSAKYLRLTVGPKSL